MTTDKKFSLRDRAKSFRYAFQGMAELIRHEHNARIHIAAALAALTLSAILRISPLEWVAIILCIALVLAAEAANTAIEALADKTTPYPHPLIKKAKDTAAAAVLILALASVIVAAIIFIPRLISLLN